MTVTDRREAGGADPERNAGEMTIYEHLAELRNRLIIAILAVIATTTVMFFFYNQLISFMEHPYCDFIAHHPNKGITGRCQLYITGPLDGFTTRIKVSVYAGIVLASPVVLWELWRFITPGLHKNEKRYVLPFFLGAVGLFSAGVVTAVLVFPKAIDWLINVSGHGVVPLFQPTRYFTLYAAMAVIFGAVFLYPLVVVFLEISGAVPSAKWRAWRRPAIVIMVVVAAVITPSSDPFSFVAMAVPLLVFYEASILIGRLLHK
ncbi:twin-arginine translocase subunit TatC [Acidiferrimicrobium sp. IK]|uniref:twin-arginine translocase subunit TatC n=1 Tax=Acidiferrimicrobium sp. IK TaxID=2871700 RepID=UPI0021CB3A7D|nr:twin-arginine translocase subunit TatC [Acidiferrimicrobium sp. IK]MCU4184673.1 twin-arginine translocase subunit TatC [Acidiferrimicrobium sp. IK]